MGLLLNLLAQQLQKKGLSGVGLMSFEFGYHHTMVFNQSMILQLDLVYCACFYFLHVLSFMWGNLELEPCARQRTKLSHSSTWIILNCWIVFLTPSNQFHCDFLVNLVVTLFCYCRETNKSQGLHNWEVLQLQPLPGHDFERGDSEFRNNGLHIEYLKTKMVPFPKYCLYFILILKIVQHVNY